MELGELRLILEMLLLEYKVIFLITRLSRIRWKESGLL